MHAPVLSYIFKVMGNERIQRYDDASVFFLGFYIINMFSTPIDILSIEFMLD